MAGKYRVLIRDPEGRLAQEFSVEEASIHELSSGHLRLSYTPTYPADPNNGVSGVLEGRLFLPAKWMMTILKLDKEATAIPFSGARSIPSMNIPPELVPKGINT